MIGLRASTRNRGLGAEAAVEVDISGGPPSYRET